MSFPYSSDVRVVTYMRRTNVSSERIRSVLISVVGCVALDQRTNYVAPFVAFLNR